MRDNKVHLDSGCKLEVRSTANGFGLGEVAFSVGLCVGKPFCQTRVIRWHG